LKNLTKNDLRNSIENENKNSNIIDIYILKFTFNPQSNKSITSKIQNYEKNKDDLLVDKKSFNEEEMITYLGVDLEFYLDLNQREKYVMKFMLLFLLMAKDPKMINKHNFSSDSLSLCNINYDNYFTQNISPKNNLPDKYWEKTNNLKTSINKLKSRYKCSSTNKILQNGEHIHIFEHYMFHDNKIYNLILTTHIISSLEYKFIISDMNIFTIDEKDHYKKLFCGFLPLSNLNMDYLEYFQKNFTWSNDIFMSNLKRNMINILHNNNEKIENINDILIQSSK